MADTKCNETVYTNLKYPSERSSIPTWNSYPVEGYFRCFGNTVGTQKLYWDVTCALSRTLLERHSLGGIPDVTCNISGKKNIRHPRIMNVESTKTSSSSVSVLKLGNTASYLSCRHIWKATSRCHFLTFVAFLYSVYLWHMDVARGIQNYRFGKMEF